jgi:hypothetical protein
MFKKEWFLVGIVSAAALVATNAHAAIMFDMAGAQGPFIDTSLPGDANTTNTVNNNGMITNNGNGFSVANFSVRYTADAAGAAAGQYRFSVGFMDTVAEKVKVTVSGNTNLTETKGATGATLLTPGQVTDGTGAVIINVASNTAIANGANATNYMWNQSNTGNLAANTEYVLSLFSGTTFTAANANDNVLVDSVYNITITPVPEPSTGLMMAVGLGGIALWLRWQGRRASTACH